MKDYKQNTSSHSWLIWGLVATVFAVGWVFSTHFATSQTGSHMGDAPVVSQEIKRPPAGEPLDDLKPVQEWFEKNVREGRNATPSYTEYVTVADDTDTISMQIPREWDDIDIMVWEHKDKAVGHLISASRDLARFESSKPEAGVSLRVYAPAQVVPTKRNITEDKGLKEILSDQERGFSRRCRSQGRHNLKNNFYDAEYEFLSGCGRAKQHVLVINAKPRNQSYAVLLNIAVTSKADVEAAAKILQSFQVLGEPPAPIK